MDDDLIKETFLLLPANYERLWTASALQSENPADAVNRAIAFYDDVHRLDPPRESGRLIRRRAVSTLQWVGGDGVRRRIARIE